MGHRISWSGQCEGREKIGLANKISLDRCNVEMLQESQDAKIEKKVEEEDG